MFHHYLRCLMFDDAGFATGRRFDGAQSFDGLTCSARHYLFAEAYVLLRQLIYRAGVLADGLDDASRNFVVRDARTPLEHPHVIHDAHRRAVELTVKGDDRVLKRAQLALAPVGAPQRPAEERRDEQKDAAENKL